MDLEWGIKKKPEYIFTLEATLQVSGKRIDYLGHGVGKIHTLYREKSSCTRMY